MAVAASGCAWRGTTAPRPLSRYLESLRKGDLRAAYDLTQLGELTRSFRSSALSFEHFSALYRAHPLKRYRIEKVTRLEIRSSAGAPGEPYHEAEVTLVTGDRSDRVTFSVTAAGVVQVEPTRVLYRTSLRPVSLDGVAVRAARAPNGPAGALAMLVLPGEHTLRAGDVQVTFGAPPLRVVSGEASVEDEVLMVGRRSM